MREVLLQLDEYTYTHIHTHAHTHSHRVLKATGNAILHLTRRGSVMIYIYTYIYTYIVRLHVMIYNTHTHTHTHPYTYTHIQGPKGGKSKTTCNEAKETVKELFQQVLGRAPDLEGLTAYAR
jgi:hypothetical protein